MSRNQAPILRIPTRLLCLLMSLATSAAPASDGSGTSSIDDEPGLLAYDGYCPVTLVEEMRWVRGDDAIACTRHGQRFLFRTETQLRQFEKRPQRYEPAARGQDVVALAAGRREAGQRRHGLVYRQRVYLFASEANLERFEAAPERFAKLERPLPGRANYVEAEP